MDTMQQTVPKRTVTHEKSRNYHEIVDYLDQHWSVPQDPSLVRMKEFDKALGALSKKIPSILVAGTNGKSLTVHFTARLLKEEGLKVGIFTSPHILLYNERFAINGETISNKIFTEISNKVIQTIENMNMKAHTAEILVLIALQFFHENGIDVGIIEVHNGGLTDPANIMPSLVTTITRVTARPRAHQQKTVEITELTKEIMGIVKLGTFITSGDQNKATLQLMQQLTEQQGGIWCMPIRKLASLPYPLEQLHGRCAALAERIAQIFIEKQLYAKHTNVSGQLLSKQKGLRGRPTLEAKRQLELNPKKTIEQFWWEESIQIPGKFQLLDKEKPTVLLDTASNIDAFENLLLGIRLLHYQHPLKGLVIIVGAQNEMLQGEEFFKQVRYFFKKTSGQIFICASPETKNGAYENDMWNAEQVANDIKSLKVKARACKNFEEAFDIAKKSVDERYGLIAVTGSHAIIQAYWKLKGIKKV